MVPCTTGPPDVDGHPYMDGTEQWITARARRFANRLHGRSGLPVHLADERLSTREAWTRLIESGSRRDGPDSVAAQVILEGWFAEHGGERDS